MVVQEDEEDRKSLNADDFLMDLDQEQELIYEEDEDIDDMQFGESEDEVPIIKDKGKPKENFPNKALLRQVNYV